jgi:hypothetical protein
MSVDGYIDYQRREYCNDISCPTQVELNSLVEGSDDYEHIRASCKDSCKHTTYEFHHWLIDRGYLIMRPEG